jgi:hypothetical protein
MKGLDELNALLEERARYERWISQLMAKREQTPQHVFERVRSDYASRLDAVMGQLRSHSQGLEASTAKLEQQVSTLSGEESTRQDARAEIELRAMVGEYTGERAQAELSAIDSELSRLERERSAAAAELSRVQEILALVRQPARGAAPSAPAAAAAPAPAPPAPAPASRPLGAPAAPPEPDSTVDELAFLNSVVDGAGPLPPPPAPSTPAAGVPRSEDIPLVTSLEASVRTEAEPATREGLSLRQAAGTPAFLKGMPTEQVKTLKCQECGTMNYPTEWYCERCGGELAAM